MEGQKKKKKSFPLLLKKKIAEDVITGQKGKAEAARHYNVSEANVRRWAIAFEGEIMRRYTREELSLGNMEAPIEDKNKDVAKKLEALEAKNELLQKKLFEANLQREALQTLIDLAEENYGISLRKNYGAKQ